jgi:DNA-binding ferritin-like protein
MIEQLLERFLSFQQQIRLYHWTTRSYARHVASGSLYESLDKKIDQFIETLQGRHTIKNVRFKMDVWSMTDKEIVKELHRFCDFLAKDIEEMLDELSISSDLKNIRDEMISLTHQTLYLFSLKK